MRSARLVVCLGLLMGGCGPHAAAPSHNAASDAASVAAPVGAGSFYPADAKVLREDVTRMLAEAPALGIRPIGLVAPHAGYVYAGPVAAAAYRQAQGQSYDVAVIVGTNHVHAGFDRVAVHPPGSVSTTLGDMAVDNQVASSLAAASDRLVLDASVFQDEHSVATQLPFVHQALPGVPVVPIVVGAPTADNVDALAAALCRVLAHRRPLLVASSDLSHYPSQADAVRVDGALLESLLTLDPVKVRQTIDGQSAAGVPNLETSACGEGGILAVMRAAVSLGADQATVVSYRNSGDTPLGDPDRVVGYGAVAFFAGSQVGGAGRQRSALPPTAAVAETASGQMATLAPDEMASLLALARSTLEQYLRTESVPSAVPQSADLRQVRGAFVTLTRDGELRGCMGSLVGRRPLYLQVQNSALMAATEDPRFYPVTLDELADLKIEISALGPLEPVTDVNQIQVGKHGLVIEQGQRAGTLLPQVPTEYGWDRDEFLRQLCRKAGLPDEAWRTSSLFRYTAEVFGEH